MTSPSWPVSSSPRWSSRTFTDSMESVAPPTEVHASPVMTPVPEIDFSLRNGAEPRYSSRSDSLTVTDLAPSTSLTAALRMILAIARSSERTPLSRAYSSMILRITPSDMRSWLLRTWASLSPRGSRCFLAMRNFSSAM